MIRIVLFALMMVFLSVQDSLAVRVTLKWNPNTESDLAGYRIYQSDTAGKYDKATQKAADIPAKAGEQKQVVIEVKPDDGRTVHFVATAYDASGNESGFSNEVFCKLPDKSAPGAPVLMDPLQQIAEALASIVQDGLRIRREP